VKSLEQVFALDIGTRIVMGLIMEKNQKGYKIIASSRTEHRQRAMYDGQVHDIEEVAKAVQIVKADLEQKTGEKIHKVSVAAAGRALKTVLASAQRSEVFPIVWEKESILALEMEAVQQALREIQSEEADTTYHCVGYSTVESHLEGQKLTRLIGQRGKEAQVKVIATFLPRTVIDGLTGVLSRCELEMENLTLEPIAAGLAAIPPDMRRMNLILVDVGAGTSDIAISFKDSFFAYGMVPMAGDQITECIRQNYLVDFQTGEKLKRGLGSKGKLSFTDFLGTKTTILREEVLRHIQPVVQDLANKISTEILRLNQGVPHAVILIGGGSLTPLLPELISEILEVPHNRVGIQIRERLNFVQGEKVVKGPEAITPIGIGISALEEQGLHYFSVGVNKVQVPIFEMQLATVSDALIAAGVSPRLIIGRPGVALTYELNGEVKIAKGSFGRSAKILLNGQPASLDQILYPEDQIDFSPALNGEDARLTLNKLLLPNLEKKFMVNGQTINFTLDVFMNGIKVDYDSELVDGCKIEYNTNIVLNDLLNMLKISTQKALNVKINGKYEEYLLKREILVNGQSALESYIFKDSDEVTITEEPLRVKDLGLKPNPLVFSVNGSELFFPSQKERILYRGHELSGNEIVDEDMELRVEGHEQMPILADILPYIEITPETQAGFRLDILINNKQGEFTTVLHPGDRIEIHWVK